MVTAPVYCRRFIGRREHLDALQERYRAAARGEGSVVLLGGDAGMGKSRLAAEFCRSVKAGGGQFVIAECLEYLQSPFAPLRAVPEVQRAFDNFSADNADKLAVFESVVRALEELASKGPLLLVIDDVHWADAATLELLQYLSTRVGQMRCVIVAAYRPDQLIMNDALRSAVARIERQKAAWRVQLEPLSEGDIRSLLHHALEGRKAPSPRLLEVVKTSADGNPLSAEELLKSAMEGAALHRSDELALPRSLTEAVLERLRPLTDEQRSILLSAAAIGRRFTPELLAQITGNSIPEVSEALKKTVDLQLLLEEMDAERLTYVFRHAITRDTIYKQLIAAQSRPLHAAIARALEENGEVEAHIAELAYHYWQARDLAKTAHYNERAGDAAACLCAFHDAATFYERVVEALSALHLPTSAVELKLAEALREAGEGQRARSIYEKLLSSYEAAGDVESAVKTCLALRIISYEIGDVDDVLRFAKRAVEIAERAEDRAVYFRALVGLANVLVNMSGTAETFEVLAQAESAVDEFPAGADSHFYFVLSGAHAVFDRTKETREAFERGLALSIRRGDWYRATTTLVGFAGDAARLGMREEAMLALEQYLALARSEKIGAHNLLNTLVRCGTTYMELGDLDAARDIIEESLSMPVIETGLATMVRANALALGLRLADENLVARAASSDLIDAAMNASVGLFSPLAAGSVADYFRSRGDLEQARALLARVIVKRWEVWAAEDVAALCVRIAEYGRAEDVEAAQAVLESIVANMPTRYERARLELFRAYAARRMGDREAMRTHAEAAERLFAELQRPYERAQVLELLDRKAEAAELYRETGDVQALRRLEKQLIPVNRRGRAKTELTNREREIAGLLAQGKSNLAIAQDLFIGERTVETHVASIFAKLGVSTRAEAVSAILRTATA